MYNYISKIIKFTFIFFFVTQVNSVSDEFSEIMNSINDIKNEYNSLMKSEIPEAKLLDEAMIEISEVVDLANKTLEKNNIENTIKTIEFLNNSLGEVSNLISDEIQSDMSNVEFEELDKNTQIILTEITENLNRNKTNKIAKLSQDALDLSEDGVDIITISRNLNTLGIGDSFFKEKSFQKNEVVLTELKIAIENKKEELNNAEAEYNLIKSTPVPKSNIGTSNALSDLVVYYSKETKAKYKVINTSSELKVLENKLSTYEVLIEPNKFKKQLVKDLESLDKKEGLKKSELVKAEKELKAVRAIPIPNNDLTTTNRLSKLTQYYLNQSKAENKVKNLKYEIKSIETDTNILSKEILSPDELKKQIKEDIKVLEKTSEIKKVALLKAEKELKAVRAIPIPNNDLTTTNRLSKLTQYYLDQNKAENKVKSLKYEIEAIDIGKNVLTKELMSPEEIQNQIKKEIKTIETNTKNKLAELAKAENKLKSARALPKPDMSSSNWNRLSESVAYHSAQIKAENNVKRLRTQINNLNRSNQNLQAQIGIIVPDKNLSMNLSDIKSVSNNNIQNEISKDVAKDIISVVKLETRDFAYNVTRIENEIAEIKELAKEGVVDLESKAKELGFNSFAEGVEAYNKQNNTNYTVEEAKNALGVK